MTTPPANPATDLAPRLVRLFSQAGLLSDEDWKKYESKRRKYKPLVEVLNQEAFSFSDLLFRVELNPFKLGGDKSSSIGDQLVGGVTTSPDELAQLLEMHRPPLAEFINALEKAKVVEPGTLGTAIGQAERLKESPYGWLVRHNLITPDLVRDSLQSPTNPLPGASALFLALCLLEHNGLIPANALKRILKKFSANLDNGIRDEIRSTLNLSSSDLVNRIEGGMYLQDLSLGEVSLEPALIELFPEEFIRHRIFLPIFQDAQRIGIATADPLDINFATFIRWVTGKWVQPFFVPSGALIDRIQEHFHGRSQRRGTDPRQNARPAQRPPSGDGNNRVPRPDSAQTQGIKGAASKDASETVPSAKLDPKGLHYRPPEKSTDVTMRQRSQEMPVDNLSAVQVVRSLIESAIDVRATDIHLEPSRENMTVRFRIDGVLNKMLNIPPNLVAAVTSRIKVLANMDVTERRRPQDGHITLEMDQRHFDFRIATLPTAYGEKVAIRILDSSRVMTGLKDTGMSAGQLETAERLIRQPYGIILVAGPTGSGKTSTLYAALHELNNEARHLVTIEDPIEYQLDGINQVQVDLNTGLTFSEGLRAILRQDPNIIMVGEIRDADTAQIAIRAALTGHLVFSTLHTNTAVGAFQALANLGATPYMLGSAICGVIAQRLVRKLCPACKKLKPITKAMAAQLGLKSATLRCYHPVGCPTCLGTGYQGRVGIFEIMEATDGVRQAVLNNESPSELLRIATAEGRQSIREAGLEKIKAGITSPEEIIQKVILDT